MAGNSIGQLFRLTTYGESHGLSIGGILDGCPAGLVLDFEQLQLALDRRRPGQSNITTQRKESDRVKFLSGIFEGKTTGTPIAFQIQNEDYKSKDYAHIKEAYRPSHADYVYDAKYGHRDYRGGGRSSARETACRVVAGNIAEQLLAHYGVQINSYVQAVGELELNLPYTELDFSIIFKNKLRCPDAAMAEKMIAYIEKIKKQGDTVGGVIQCVVQGLPVGLGEPVFDKLHSDLAKAMMSINAVKGFEYGSGFGAAKMLGSQHNDEFYQDERGNIRTKTNRSGGIQGGISNGEDIYCRIAFKPIATIMKDQKSVNKEGEKILIQGKGRHDPSVLPRAVPIVSAMAGLVLADHLLRSKTIKL